MNAERGKGLEVYERQDLYKEKKKDHHKGQFITETILYLR